MRLKFALAPVLDAVTSTLFPGSCALCPAETGGAATLCPDCWREIAFIGPAGCRHCGRPLPGPADDGQAAICEECLVHPPAWDRGAAVFRYEGAGRKLVLALKHADRLDLIPMLAAWAGRAARELTGRAELVVPVPLHWTRRLSRRSNQAAELARRLVRDARPGPAFAPRLLVRTRRTASQDGGNRATRAANVAGAMALGPGPDPAGRRILLVDDVLTTGATLNEAARVCLDAGAASVDILVLALVMRDESAYMRAPDEDEANEAS